MIELKHVSKSFTSLIGTTEILNDVSFKLPDTGFVALCGRSGCGKTTLLNIIGFDDLDYSGEIIYDEINIKELKKKEINKYKTKHIFYLKSRNNFIKNIKVKDALNIYLSKAQQENAKKLIEKFGLESLLNKQLKKLSSGEIQKISIIIAGVKKAHITLLDEPICNIEEKSISLFLDLIKELSKTGLVIYISHYEDDFDKYFDQIIDLENGKITFRKNEELKLESKALDLELKYSFKNSLILEKSKPLFLYSMFRLIVIMIFLILIFVGKLNQISVGSIYESSLDNMGVNIVEAKKSSTSDALKLKKIYKVPDECYNTIYLNDFTAGVVGIEGFGKASDFSFAGFDESLNNDEIIISDYLAYKNRMSVGDTVGIHCLNLENEVIKYSKKYTIVHIYKTDYASLLKEERPTFPQEYSYVFVSDGEIERITNESLNSYGGIALDSKLTYGKVYVTAYDSKFIGKAFYYQANIENFDYYTGWEELADDEFFSGQVALTYLGLFDSIVNNWSVFMNGSDEYFDITFSYQDKSITKKLKYRKMVSPSQTVVVSPKLLAELKSYFGINEDNVLNYEEVTILDKNSEDLNSYLSTLSSFDDLTFMNDSILAAKNAKVSSIVDIYNSNYHYMILFLAIFFVLSLYKIVQIEYEYIRLLRSKNYSYPTNIGLTISTKLIIYLIITLLLYIIYKTMVVI